MSAICGMFNWGGAVTLTPAIERMTQALRHHGPDRQRHWAKGPIALGHCQMRMTPEDQFDAGITHSADGRFALVADGRLDNRAELTAQWGLATEETRHWSDSDFLLQAFARWGTECGAWLYGEFCFAVWDNVERRLTLVRDPLGDRTLFYHQSPSGFVAFATAPAGLFALPEVPRALDEAKLADFLILNHQDHQSTHYQQIHRLPPAHYLTAQGNSRSVAPQRYWQIDLNKRIHYPRDQDYVDAFNALFERVVADHLRSIHPVGAFMSGGVDSSAVAATAARQLKVKGLRLSSFTAVPREGLPGRPAKGRYNDETPLVRAIVALHDNLDPHFVRAEGKSPLDHLDEYFQHTEAPFRNSSNRVWMEAILREAQSQGLRVMLTGSSGNMTISWEGTWALGDWLRRGRWRSLAHGLYTLHGYRKTTAWGHFRNALRQSQVLPEPLLRLYRRLRRSPGDEQIPPHSAINPVFAGQQQVFARARSVGFDPGYRQPPDGRLARWGALEGLDYSGDIQSGWRAAFGVEQRDPTGDRRLIEFCLAIPQEQFLSKGQMRWLAKRAFADRLPPAVLNNERSGAQDPGWHERLTAVRAAIQADLARMRGNEQIARVLDLDKMQRLVDQWPAPHAPWQSRELTRHYRLCLNRGLMVGRFVRWFEGDNQ